MPVELERTQNRVHVPSSNQKLVMLFADSWSRSVEHPRCWVPFIDERGERRGQNVTGDTVATSLLKRTTAVINLRGGTWVLVAESCEVPGVLTFTCNIKHSMWGKSLQRVWNCNYERLIKVYRIVCRTLMNKHNCLPSRIITGIPYFLQLW